MGTRGTWGLVLGEKEALAYNQFDSYPDGLGAEVWKLCRDLGVDGLKEAVERMRLVSQESPPTAEDIERYEPWTTWRNGRTDPPEWYDVLYKTHGDPRATLEAGCMEADGALFALDSLFCEWGYVIDLNTEVFEVYEGFQEGGHDQGRFAKRKLPDGSRARLDYAPIKLICSWPLGALPATAEQFCHEVNSSGRYAAEYLAELAEEANSAS